MNTDTEKGNEFFLKFGNRKPDKTGVPLLAPYYSYLLKLSPSVGLVEIYPWLAELIFCSVAVNTENNANEEIHPVNVISFFIDDQRKNIALSMGWNNVGKVDDPFLGCLIDYCESSKIDNNWPRNFVVDTFGRFGVSGHFELTPESEGKYTYMWSSLVGAGNPMRMKERFTHIGRRKDIELKGNNDHPKLGELNCFLINSISSLYRTMGFRDAMLLVRAMLQDGVWKPEEPKGKDSLLSRPGMMFAILNEGVFASDEIQYAETFFDGIFRFEKEVVLTLEENETKLKEGDRLVTVSIERFPLIAEENENFSPKYAEKYGYIPRGRKRVEFINLQGYETQPLQQSTPVDVEEE